MPREAAIASALSDFDSGKFMRLMASRVAVATESQSPESGDLLNAYLEDHLRPSFEAMGFVCRILHASDVRTPFLYAERIEGLHLTTVLGYGHGDVILGMEGWNEGLTPWQLTERDGRWYGRGTADNKAQHSVNMLAQAAVLRTRGALGFNAKWLIEMGEEIGSPGLHEICTAHRDLLTADVLIASDGPRLNVDRPTLFLGSRGEVNVDLTIQARDAAHHSGNWGGLLSNPAIQLAHAVAALVSSSGEILVPELKPAGGLPDRVREVLADCTLDHGSEQPRIDEKWGEGGLTGPEKVFGWSSFEVLTMTAGDPLAPVNAIPPSARARCHLRTVVGVDLDEVVPAIRRRLREFNLDMVQVERAPEPPFRATRLELDNPWIAWALASIQASTGKKPALLPNFGGSLPNDAFAEILGLPTMWVPHSYPGCLQHAPNEHLPITLVREAIALMTGLYWDVPCTPYDIRDASRAPHKGVKHPERMSRYIP